MSDLVVVDTGVLQKANAPLANDAREISKFASRLRLLGRIRNGEFRVLISRKLMVEYRAQVREPRNDFVRSFFAVVDNPQTAVPNWCRWSGSIRSHAKKCRFPQEDYHVLRTAKCDLPSTILCEEHRMLVTDACIHRRLNVHVVDPTAR